VIEQGRDQRDAIRGVAAVAVVAVGAGGGDRAARANVDRGECEAAGVMKTPPLRRDDGEN